MDSDVEATAPQPRAGLSRLCRLILGMIVLTLALLSFPSVLPWMIAFWLVCSSILARTPRRGWLPLVICLAILVVKLVPRTPAMLFFCLLLAGVAATQYRQRGLPRRSKWWLGPALLWFAWGFLYWEWESIERCGRKTVYVANRPVVCIGDSLTEGMLPDHGYPEQLKSMVRNPVVNLGFSGISTSQGLGQMERVLGHRPLVVVIELGGHDFLKHLGRSSAKENLVEMIRLCRAQGAEVVLMEIPRGFLFDPWARLEREIAYEQDVQLVSDTWLREVVLLGPAAPPGRWFPEWRLSDDGIHSNPQGSRSIARHVAEALHEMYGDPILTPIAAASGEHATEPQLFSR